MRENKDVIIMCRAYFYIFMVLGLVEVRTQAPGVRVGIDDADMFEFDAFT